MSSLAVTFTLDGAFPVPESVSPITIDQSSQLFFEGSSWKMKLKLDAENQTEGIRAARSLGNEKLILFQVFMAGSSTGFRVSIPDDSGCVVEDLTSGGRVVRSNTLVIGVAGASERASVVVTSNIRPAIEAMNRVYPNPSSQNDCRILLYYYRRSIAEAEPLYRFLNAITAIESMLSESAETTEKISRRLAVLVSSQYDNMQNTFEEFKDFYGTRSRILHGDKIPALSETTVEKVSELARCATRSYLMMRMTLSEERVKQKLDKFLEPVSLSEVKTLTTISDTPSI
jgi:hypothetical protein